MTGADRGAREAAGDAGEPSSRGPALPPGIRQLANVLADGLAEFANATIGLDPAGAARLAALEGSRVLIRSLAPAGVPGPEEIAFTLTVAGGRLRLRAEGTEAANAVVTGSLPDLVAWALGRGRHTPAGLRIDGDSRLLETLAEIGSAFSPDLEPPLGRVIGAANATRLLAAAEVALAGARSLLQVAATGVRQGAGQWFATDAGFRGFLDELDELRLAVDRLSARVELAERRAEGPQVP